MSATGNSHETGNSSDEDASHYETLGTDDSSDVSDSDVSDVIPSFCSSRSAAAGERWWASCHSSFLLRKKRRPQTEKKNSLGVLLRVNRNKPLEELCRHN